MGIRPKILHEKFSTGETAAVEKGLLFLCSGTAERGVAVREPSEPPNDAGVNFRPFQIFRIACGFVQSYAALLVGKILGMLKGKIEEVLQLLRHLTVESTHDGSGRDRARQWIGCKRARVAAKHVSRKLVQQKEQCQGAFGVLLPAGQLSVSGRLVGRKKLLADLVVERCVLFEPPVRTCLLPE